MAAKLELRFTQTPLENETITVFTGVSYVFRAIRTGFRQVTIGDATEVAGAFGTAFNTDDNYLNQFTVNYTVTNLDEAGISMGQGVFHGICTIEHFDNDKFNSFDHSTTGLLFDITTTEQQSPATLDVALSQSPTDACGKFLLNVDSNVVGGRVTVEMPVGNTILTLQTSQLPYAFDRIRPATSTSGVVKLFETEFTSTVLKQTFFTAPGVLSISDVEIKGTPFGASAKIIANGTNLQYSLDNIGFQESKEYVGIFQGNHTAYVKDSYGCTKSLAFVVTADQTSGLTAPPFIKVPIHNSIRFADRNGSTFLNFLAKETPSFLQIQNYYQDYMVNDVVRMQFKSSYAVNRVFSYDCDGAETEIAIVKKSDNISRKNIYEGNYAAYDGRLSVYFTSGNIYNADDSIKATHTLNGLLPDWYYEGMFLNIEGVGVTSIDRIVLDEDNEIRYAVTQLDSTATTLSKKITSIHTADPYEVYEFELNFLTAGNFIYRLDYGQGEFYSEPVKVSSELSDKYLKVEWFSEDNNDIVYGTGIRQMRRLKWAKYFTYISKSEKETFYSDTTLGLVNSKSHSTYELSFMPMPMEMARGLDFGFNAAGTTVIINGAQFVCDGAFKAEPFGSMYKVSAELTLTDQSMKGKQNTSDTVSGEFLIVEQDANGASLLRL